MPTGYTDMIDSNPKMTTQQWIMTGLARAFGVCVTLKEDSLTLTEEQIREQISKNYSIEYHEKELADAIKEKEKLTLRTEDEWQTLWKTHEAMNIKSNKQSEHASKKRSQRHFKVRQELVAILDSPTTSEETKAIAKFGIEQLDLVQDECKPYLIKPTTFKAYKAGVMQSNIRDIEYHKKELAGCKQRVADSIAVYSRLRKDVDAVLGKES